MDAMYDEFHANKSERLRSFENTVKNIFDEKFGDCFEKAKSPESVTHVQIFDNNGKYYFKKVHGSFEGTLNCFDIEGQHKGRRINKYYNNSRDYTKYILEPFH